MASFSENEASSPFVSIIIPVYNVEPYLQVCLNSIKNQSLLAWEAICIDDGSSDRSGAILDSYAATDTRFRVIHQPNSGVSAARNKGLEIALGRYVMFVDSDDWIDADMAERLVTAMEETWADLGLCRSMRHKSSGEPEDGDYSQIESAGQYEFMEMNPKVITLSNNSVWLKIFRRAIIKQMGLLFPVGVKYGEDMEFCLNYLTRCASVVFWDSPFYHYRSTNGAMHVVNEKNVALEDAQACVQGTLRMMRLCAAPHLTKRQKRGFYTYQLENCLGSRSGCLANLPADSLEPLRSFPLRFALRTYVQSELCTGAWILLKYRFPRLIEYVKRGKNSKLGFFMKNFLFRLRRP